MRGFFQRYLLPGLVFQSVIVGGGYGTGREIAEYFVANGALGGLLGMGAAALGWGVILALAFEFARMTKSYDYRAFFKALLGPGWRLFEILYLLIALLILSVLGSAAGEMAAAALGAPPVTGSLALLTAIGVLAYYGRKVIERVLVYWSFLLYAVYTVFLVWALSLFGGEIGGFLAEGEIVNGWAFDGLRYAAYNLIGLGAILFVLPYLRTRKEALCSGLLAGVLGIVPAVFVFLAMLSGYPDIQGEPVPVLTVLQSMNSIWFFVVFQVVLFGTFIETGVGIVHAVNERIAATLTEQGRPFPHWARFAVAAGVLGCAIFLARAVGIIDLVAKGYGALSYAFIAIVALPLMTYGVWRIVKFKNNPTETVSESS